MHVKGIRVHVMRSVCQIYVYDKYIHIYMLVLSMRVLRIFYIPHARVLYVVPTSLMSEYEKKKKDEEEDEEQKE